MSEGEKARIDDESRELLVLQALRALLGNNRAQTALVNLQNKDAVLSAEVMAEAQARYDKFTLNNQEDINKALIQVSLASTKLRLNLLMRKLPKAVLLSIPRIPKFLLVSLPRALKRLFLK